MITAVDTSVLLDLFLADPKFADVSARALQRADIAGALVVCEVVYAELAAQFPQKAMLDRALGQLGIQLDAIDEEIAFAAGRAFRAYRDRGGPRSRIMADFLIGAHAQKRAAALLSRDRRFFREHFRKLRVVDPLAE
jgi:predicted nucleic acid-binding protein